MPIISKQQSKKKKKAVFFEHSLLVSLKLP